MARHRTTHASRRALALACLLGATAVVDPAAAQGMQSPAQWFINQNIYSTRVFNGMVANSMLDAGRRGAATGAAGAGATDAAPAEPTRYVPRAASIVPARLAGQAGGTAEARRAAQADHESHLALYAETARRDGFPANDLAYAHQYFVVNAYQVHRDLVNLPTDRDPYLRGARDGFERIALAARKRTEQVTPAQERALYEQFRRRLGESPEVRRMSDAEKQEATETLAIAFGVIWQAYLRGVDDGDDALRGQAQRAAREGLEKLLGRPVERIRIGYDGLEP